MATMATTRKRFTMNAPPQLSTFADELNDYEDEDEEYEGVEGDVIDQFKDDRDDSSVLAEQLGNHLDLRSPTDPQSPSVEEEKLVDILQQRLFVSREAEDEHVVAESPRYESISPPRNSSMISSLEEFMADRTSRQNSYKQTLDRDAQRVLLKTFSQDQSKTPSISPQRVVQMNNRFRICEEKKTRRLNAKRRETETQENVEYRFAPTINSKSRQLTSDFPTFAERQVTLLAKKRLQRARLEQQREQESRHDRTVDLHESVQTPCICSRGNTNRSENCAMSASPSKGAPVDAVRHSQACMRFMSMCSKMNASFAIHRKKEMMRRSIEDIIAYQDGKKQRQKARAAIQKAKEEKKTTFAPQINAKSEKIYAALIRSGKLDSGLQDRMLKPQKASPESPKFTFQPTITKKSKWLLKKKQRELEAATNEDTTNEDNDDITRPASPLPLDVFSRLQQLSRHRDSEAQRLQQKKEEEAKKANPPVEWNVIPYDAASCSFILQGFDRPNALS